MKDLLGPVIDKLLREAAERIPDVPSELTQDYAVAGGWGGMMAGAAVGGKLGGGIGIAMGPLGAIADGVPGALLGGIIGYFSGDKAGSKFQK